MYLYLTICLVIFGIFLHEYGHLYAMHQYGIRVKELCIGIPVPGITIQFRSKLYGTRIRLSPIFLLGWVEAENKEDFGRLPLRPNLEIDSAGVIANFAYGFALIAVVCLMRYNLILATGSATVVVLILVFRKIISAYLIPVVSLVVSTFVPHLIVDTFRVIPDAGKGTSNMLVGLKVANTQETLMWAAIISILVAVINLVPLMPMDGGRIISACAKKWLPPILVRGYGVLTLLIMLAMILVSTYDLVLGIIRAVLRIL